MVHEGQVSFNTTDRDGAMRIVSYDPAGEYLAWGRTGLLYFLVRNLHRVTFFRTKKEA